MKKFVALGVFLVVLAVPAWLVLKTDHLSGSEFEAKYRASVEHAYSSWYLFKVTNEEYCFRYSRPIVPKNYCVPTSDVVVRNTRDGKAESGFVSSRQLFLKRPGEIPAEQPFTVI